MTPSLRNERGSALIITLMCAMLLTALGLGLVLTTTTETMISANYRASQETLYAADAGIERAIQDLLQAADWDALLSGAETSGFTDAGTRVAPDGTTLDLPTLTGNLQIETDAIYGGLPNRPVWQIYAHAPLSAVLPTITNVGYVIVWVADDVAETDGDPARDSNGIVMLHSEAFGEGGSRKVIEALMSRSGELTSNENGYGGQQGMGEQNQRRRDSAIGSPGGGLTEMRMGLESGGMVIQ